MTTCSLCASVTFGSHPVVCAASDCPGRQFRLDASDKTTEGEAAPRVEPKPKRKRKPVPLSRQIRLLRDRMQAERDDNDRLRRYVRDESNRRSIEAATAARVSQENGRLRQAVINLQVTGKMAGVPWTPTHVHLTSGGLYRVLRRGKIEATLDDVVIYDNIKEETWVRPAAEFDDGRFMPVKP